MNELSMSIKTSKFLLKLIDSDFMQCKNLQGQMIKRV